MRKLVISLLLALTVLAFSAPAMAQDNTIVGVAASVDDFSTLVAAVQAAGLVDTLNGPGPFTVFAPTNGAFATLLGNLGVSAEELLANRSLLTSVLLYHVVPGEVKAADITGATFLPFNAATAGGELVKIGVAGGKVTLNDGAAIVTVPDIQTSNGVIHVIDNVILPPSVTGQNVAVADGPNIVETAASISDFSTLVAAVQAAGLVDTLSGEGPFTVFAPTNGAFATLLSNLGVTAEQLLADTDLLTTVLTYHVIPGRVEAKDILAATTPFNATSVQGSPIVVNVVGGKVNLNNGQAIVTIADIQTSNGVIHVIDNVILPPSN